MSQRICDRKSISNGTEDVFAELELDVFRIDFEEQLFFAVRERGGI